jgi:hypothetical protein
MKKNTLVQFVCFVTNLEPDEFVPKWERYAKKLIDYNPETTLLQQVETKSKYRYISQHDWQDRDVHFSFMNDRRSEHFPEHNAKVVQIGGYTLLQTERRKHIDNNDLTKLIAFISHEEYDVDYFRTLPLYSRLTIYQPYYESCSYGYVMEFFVPEIDADDLARQIKERKGTEVGTYKECMMAHL